MASSFCYFSRVERVQVQVILLWLEHSSSPAKIIKNKFKLIKIHSYIASKPNNQHCRCSNTPNIYKNIQWIKKVQGSFKIRRF
jgi:hypothetical protein